MSRYPASPDEILDEFVADYRNLLDEDLISVVLFGRATSGVWKRKESEINFLLIVKPAALESIGRILPCVKKWQKRAVAVPMVMSEEYLLSSLDSFPLEFFNLIHSHKLIYGKDVLKPLQISMELLRLQCENQIKGKLVHLRAEFLATQGDAKKIRRLIQATIPTFTHVFKGLLTFKGLQVADQPEAVFKAAAETYSLDYAVLERVLQAGRTRGKLEETEGVSLMEKYIAEIRKLAFAIDQTK